MVKEGVRNLLIGSIGLLMTLILVILGIPIAYSIAVTAIGGIIYVSGFNVAVSVIKGVTLNYIASYTWTVLPMFILMGQLGYYCGLFNDVFDVARKWLGHISGGLAISVEAANAIFAAVSGSSQAACIVVGQAAIPIMRKYNYGDRLSTGVVAAGGSIAALIPPSLTICIYGLLVDESIAKLLVAGIIPGIVTALIYTIFIYLRCRKLPIIKEKFTWKERIVSIRYLWIIAVLIITIMGGIYNGWITPTEAGAVGAFTVFLLALFLGKINIKGKGDNILWKSLEASVTSTGKLLIIIIAAMLLSRFLVLSDLTGAFSNILINLQFPNFIMFLIVTLIYFILGCFLGGIGMLVLTLPIIYPLMMELGFDSVWFGIICVKYVEMAVITPPMGVNIYAVKSVVGNDIPVIEIIKGALPFLSMDLLTILIFYLFPEIITFLPSLMGY